MISADKFLRQQGMVDQTSLGNLRVFLSGSAEGVAELIVLLYQLGVGSGEGQIGFYENNSSVNIDPWLIETACRVSASGNINDQNTLLTEKLFS